MLLAAVLSGHVNHAARSFRGELSRMYSPTPTKYITCAIPNSGAMTSARQPAPFRKAVGPSFRMILLLKERKRVIHMRTHTFTCGGEGG